MKYLILKDRRRRILYSLYERRHNVLLSLVQNISLSPKLRTEAYIALINLPRESSITRLRNRCTLTGRSRAIYQKFGISRLRFRKLA
jgi:ribosomal protein S14